MSFWVNIEDASGNKIGAGPLRPSYYRVTDKLSKSGEFEFDVAPSDPNFSVLAEKLVAVCYEAGETDEFGSGVIDSIKANIDEQGVLRFIVSGNTRDRELTYRSVGNLKLESGGAGVTDGPAQIMALAPSGWSLIGGTTAKEVYAGFDGESVLNAMTRVGTHIGEHFRHEAGRVIRWLGTRDSFGASGVRLVQHVNDPKQAQNADDIGVISNLTEVSDAFPIVTRVMPRGSGNGNVIIDLQFVTDSAPAGFTLDKVNNVLINTVAEATYGRIEKVVDFKELGPLSNTTADIQNASNMILQASVEYLRRRAKPAKNYDLDIAGKRDLVVGTTARVVYRKLINGAVVYDLNAEFNIVEVTREISVNGTSMAVQISSTDRLAMSDDEFLASQVEEARVLATRQQLGPSVDTFSWQDEMDNAHGASIPFFLDNDYTNINRAVLRFRVEALRSTVKSVAGESTTTESGGGSTSGSGGSSSPTSNGGPHQHLYRAYGDNNNHLTSYDSPGHTHDVSIPDHTHSTPDHSHTLTPVVNMEYGIFEESATSTLDVDDLVIKLNGGSDLSGDVDDIGSGWYELDITDELVDDAFRPKQDDNIIAITTSVAKTARIEAQLKLRGAVQAVVST